MTLSLQNMQIGYKNKPIIQDIALPEIQPGSLIALLGANAVGKSTLLKSLSGFLKYQGIAALNGQQLAKLNQAERMQSIGYLPQTLPQPTTLVAYELVYSACRAARGHLDSQSIERQIEHTFSRLGIAALALKKMDEMSGGQRQMVGLAQVLVRQPELLLLDEPTSALDLHWQLNVLQTVRKETTDKQRIAIIASHDLNLALRFCDQVMVLANGKVLAFGKPDDVLTPACLQQAYQVQGRIERCSQGYLIVLADQPSNPQFQTGTHHD